MLQVRDTPARFSAVGKYAGKLLRLSTLVLFVRLCTVGDTGAQPQVGALGSDERQRDQLGCAADYETEEAARCSICMSISRLWRTPPSVRTSC